jgi:hypothetical protein
LLLGLYLGDGHIAPVPHGAFVLRIYQDAKYVGLIDECVRVLAAVKAGARTSLVSMPGCTSIQTYWKHWPCLFPQHGPGHKHERPIVLADWQRELVELDPRPFVRGLIHSDGCRITNWTVRPLAAGPKRYEYPRYYFTNHSDDIRGLFCWALDLLEIPWRPTNRWNISVARREGVRRLDEFVGLKF